MFRPHSQLHEMSSAPGALDSWSELGWMEGHSCAMPVLMELMRWWPQGPNWTYWKCWDTAASNTWVSSFSLDGPHGWCLSAQWGRQSCVRPPGTEVTWSLDSFGSSLGSIHSLVSCSTCSWPWWSLELRISAWRRLFLWHQDSWENILSVIMLSCDVIG